MGLHKNKTHMHGSAKLTQFSKQTWDQEMSMFPKFNLTKLFFISFKTHNTYKDNVLLTQTCHQSTLQWRIQESFFFFYHVSNLQHLNVKCHNGTEEKVEPLRWQRPWYIFDAWCSRLLGCWEEYAFTLLHEIATRHPKRTSSLSLQPLPLSPVHSSCQVSHLRLQ